MADEEYGRRFVTEAKDVCSQCKHFHVPLDGGCDAYPDGIPFHILIGEFDHRTHYPHKDDHGILFEPKELVAPK